ncbi:MAG: CHAP domain-containing protein [Bacteroidota bacterium]
MQPRFDWRPLALFVFVALGLAMAVAPEAQPAGASVETPPGELIESPSGRRFFPTGYRPLDVALSQVGVVERPRNSNRGPDVEKYLRSVGVGPGAPWCASFTSWCRIEASRQTVDQVGFGPFTRSGRPFYSAVATAHFGYGRKIRMAEVWRGARAAPVGSLVIWRRGTGWQGHIGFVWKDDDPTDEGFARGDRSPEARAWRHRCGVVVEGNAQPGRSGNQRNGGGVYTRDRCGSHSYFKIEGFIAPQTRDL